jgi:Glycosyl transferase family 8
VWSGRQIGSHPNADDEFGRAGNTAPWITVPANNAIIKVSDVAEIQQVSDAFRGAVEHAWAGKYAKSICYVTLCSSDYEWGLRVLLRSLRKVSSVPLIVIAARRWSVQCDEPDVLFVEVPALVNPQYEPHRREYSETLTKLWVFALTCFHRVTFVDADCLFLHSIDDLFDQSGFLAGADYVVNSTQHSFNSGLLSFAPTPALRDLIFEQAQHAASPEGADQGLLNTLLQSKVRLLPPEYDLMRHYNYYGGIKVNRDEIRMIHYIVKKPWELAVRETSDLSLIDLDDLWTKQLTRDELLALIGEWRRRQHLSVWHQEEQIRSQRRRRRNRIIIIAGFFTAAAVFFGLGYLTTRGLTWPR